MSAPSHGDPETLPDQTGESEVPAPGGVFDFENIPDWAWNDPIRWFGDPFSNISPSPNPEPEVEPSSIPEGKRIRPSIVQLSFLFKAG